MDISFLLFLALCGLGVGTLAGMLGVGGGLLTVPALAYLPSLLGLPLISFPTATAVGALQGLFSATSSAPVHWKAGFLQPKLVVLLGGSAMLGAWFGGQWSNTVPVLWLQILLALSLILASIAYLKKHSPGTSTEKTPFNLPHLFAHTPTKRWVLLIALSLGVGVLAGLLGIGGSIFLIPLMLLILKLPLRVAIGCGAGTVLLITLATVVGKWQSGLFNGNALEIALVVSVASFVGSFIGAKLSPKVSVAWLNATLLLLNALALARTLYAIGGAIINGVLS